MINKPLSYFGAIALITTYLLMPLVAIWHTAEAHNYPNCPACREAHQRVDGPSLAERCDNPDCHNPAHHHHNHPVHDENNCPLCQTFASYTVINEPFSINLTGYEGQYPLRTVAQPVTSANLQSGQPIRGPPAALPVV